MNMKPSKNCYDLIKHFESLSLEAYLCPAGVWTIGWGHTKGVKKGMEITEAQAERFLIEDVQEAVNGVNKYVEGAISQYQFDALVSFTFNLGVGNLRSSTLLKLVNARRFDAAVGEFKKWVMSKGKKLDGLVRRRTVESILFRSGSLRWD